MRKKKKRSGKDRKSIRERRKLNDQNYTGAYYSYNKSIAYDPNDLAKTTTKEQVMANNAVGIFSGYDSLRNTNQLLDKPKITRKQQVMIKDNKGIVSEGFKRNTNL